MIRGIIFILLFNLYLCDNINQFFEKVNEDVVKLNSLAANIAWNRGTEYSRREENYQLQNIIWHRSVCRRIGSLHNNKLLNRTQERQAYLLCRGASFTFSEARDYTKAYNEIQKIYNDAKMCIPDIINNLSMEEAILNFISSVKGFMNSKNEKTSVKLAANYNHGACLIGDDDFEKMMKSNNEEVLKWVWLAWREKNQSIKTPFAKLVTAENDAVRNNHYNNIGEVWREELEVENIRQVSRELYDSVLPLYQVLHGVARYYLRQKYGDALPEKGLIPAHLLGSLWPHNWESLTHLIIPNILDLDTRIKHRNWTVKYMVQRTEDFYMSLGLPALPDSFWQNSILTGSNESRCYIGAAANMFKNDDVRISYCSGNNLQDFSVLHHELGHIQYFMAYKHQPGIFRQANTMLHESIGDAIMYGAITPQHLNRLRLITDTELYKEHKLNDEFLDSIKEDNNGKDENELDEKHEIESEEFNHVDYMILLKQILYKLPQIPYSLLIEEYRWRYFENSLDKENLNAEFWTMAKELMGIAPPSTRNEEHFDIGAEMHVADNIPHMRYFLSSFIQHQIFESLCKASVFGQNDNNKLPKSIPLHRCDIYGSKVAGKMLKDLMSRGHSQHWQEILSETIGEDEISTSSLQRYYRPLVDVLLRLVESHRIPLGW